MLAHQLASLQQEHVVADGEQAHKTLKRSANGIGCEVLDLVATWVGGLFACTSACFSAACKTVTIDHWACKTFK